MLKYYLFAAWQAIVDHALPLAGMLLTAILIPRIGRLAVRIIESRLDENQETTKARLALAGALVYVAQAVAYFLLVLAALSNLGVPALGAAIPATVVSAAVGFGAQKIIGDFLAGFFILSEKQFGVGDYVSFDGVTGVEGTVVSLTLRTTKVRTPTGEVVMVPNGSAGVVTNYSQEWSRAVVDIAIPVHEGESLPAITSQVEKISHRAIRGADIRSDVAGELDVLPATGLVAPTAAGQPWQVKYRVLVQVNPARQWAVERAIRSALLAAFWDHYKLPTADAVLDDVSPAPTADDAPSDSVSAAPTEVFASAADDESADSPEQAAATATATESTDNGPGKPAFKETAEDEEEDEPRRGIWRADTPKSKWEYFWTLGGRVRASTTALFAGVATVGLLLLASANPDGTSAGWLSPARWSSGNAPESAAPQPPGTEATTEPGASTAPAEPTALTEESDTTEATAPTDTMAPEQPTGTTALTEPATATTVSNGQENFTEPERTTAPAAPTAGATHTPAPGAETTAATAAH